jgi:prepilin-type N-terminal cleavage/methylation domain-containing protein
MRRESGFTLIELLVVVAIMGILAATAIPLYNTWQQRAYGSEAVIMMKQITEGEILYLLEHDDYFPPVNETFQVFKNGTGDPADAIDQLAEALKLTIKSRTLDFSISNQPDIGVTVIIRAGFPIFKNGQDYLMGVLDKEGNLEYTSQEGILGHLSGA